MQVTVFVIAFFMALVAALSPLAFDVLFADEWQGAVVFIQILCGVGVLYPVHSLNINVLNVKGKSGLILKIGILKKSINMGFLIVSIPFGILGIVFSQLVGSVFSLIPNIYYTRKLVGYSYLDQFLDCFKPISVAVISGVIVGLMSERFESGSIMLLAWMGLLYMSLYVLGCFIFRVEGFQMIFNKVVLLAKKKQLKA